MSDTFVANDVALPIMLKVEEVPEDDMSDEEGGDDISEPDEDSLAGQMALMKGGKVRPSAIHGQDGEESEGEEDGSEYESSSDEEGPRKGRAINEDSDSDDD